MNHLTDDTLMFYRFGTLDAAAAQGTAEHLRTCVDCSKRYAALGDAVGRLSAWDVEANADAGALEHALSRATAALQAKTENRAALPSPVADAAKADAEPQVAAPEPETERRRPVPPPLQPKVKRPPVEAPPFDLLQWLGVKAGAGFRPVRLATLSAVLLGAVYLGGGEAVLAARSNPLDTQVSGDDSVLAGGRALYRVSLHRGAEPIVGADVKATLVSGGEKTPLVEAKTGAGGDADLSFALPLIDDPHPVLEVETRAGRETDRVSHTLAMRRDYKVSLSCDKPLYQPGQTVHLRALAMSMPSVTPAKGKPLTIEVRDARNVQIAQKEVTVSPYGVASYDLELADDLALGTWKVTAKVGDTVADASFEIARYTLPKFKLALTPNKETFLAGERFKAHLSARYFFGKPVARAEIHALLLEANGVVLAELNGKTDEQGGYDLAAELPPRLAAPGRPQPITVQLEAKDAAGQEERSARTVTVARELLLVDLLPDGIPQAGLPNTFFVVVTTPDGSPVAADVEVELPGGASQKLHTAQTGVGRFEFTPASPGPATFSLQVEDAQGRRASKPVQLGVQSGSMLLVTDKAFYRSGEAVKVKLYSASASGQWAVEAREEGRVLARTLIDLSKGTDGVLELPQGVLGTLALHAVPAPVRVHAAYAEPGPVPPAPAVRYEKKLRPREDFEPPPPLASRRIVVADPVGLKVKMTANQGSWKPGDDAKLRFEITDESGKPKAAALGISVVDESLYALASARPALARAFFVVEKALLNPHYGSSAGELVGGGGWNDEVQTAARLLLTLEPEPATHANLYRFEESTAGPKLQQLHVARRQFEEREVWVAWGLGLLVVLVLVLTASARISPGLLGLALGALVLLAIALGVSWLVASVVGLGLGLVAAVLQYRRDGEVSVTIIAVPLLCGIVLATLYTSVLGSRQRSMALSAPETVGMPAPSMSKKQLAMPVDQMAEVPMAAPAAKASPADRPTKGNLKVAAALDQGAAFEDVLGNGKAAAEPPRREVRVRQHFPETLYVNPQLVTDEQGVAELTVPLADSITSWRLTALASSADGKLGSLDEPLKVFQDFFVDLDTPVALVRGDEATMPIAVYNYLDAPQRVRLEVEKARWFEVLGSTRLDVALKPGAVEGLSLRIRVLEEGTHTLKVRADGTEASDIVARQLLVSEAGREDSTTVSGSLEAGKTESVALLVPAAAVGQVRLSLKLYPNVVATALDGIEGTLTQPVGCFEQTSSSTYPNLLVLEHLRKSKRATPELEARAQRYLSLGYQRLVGFEVAGGGFEWFGRAPANTLLTAYGLMEFTDLARVSPVDPELIARTRRFLEGRQQGDGAWEPDRQMLSDGLFRSEHAGRLTVTAYVAWALAESGANGHALERAQGYLEQNLDEAYDSYTLALIAAGFARTSHPAFAKAAAALEAKAVHDKDLAYFSPSGATAYYGRGASGEVETTALATYALELAQRNPELVKGAREFLLARRSAHGAWGSTQATILSMKALLQPAENKPAPKVAVKVNGVEAGTFTLEGEGAKVMQLDEKAKKGSNVIELTSDGDAPFLATAGFTIPWRSKGDDEKQPLALHVDYGAKKVEVGGIVPVDLKLTYRGTEPSGMVMVELGVPAGLAPVGEDLEAAKKGGAIGKYQLVAGKVRLYFDRVGPGATVKLALRFKANLQVDTQGAGSLAYLYYDPSVRASAPAVAVAVR